jgi:hypothetical protein
MSDYAPILLRIVDDQGQELFRQTVPFEFELDVKEVMERAFVLAQTPAKPDPVVFEVQFYGYSESVPYPGYLGYEIESIQGKPNNQQFYWELKINGAASQEGADSTQPGPGSEVLWEYTPIAAAEQQLTGRAQAVHARRRQRASVTQS